MQLENSPFMLKTGILQNIEVIARVFWAPGSQDLPTVGEQICWNVHRTCPDPTSPGHEHTAVVWRGTTTIVFHVAGQENILSAVRCPILCWGPQLVPPPWAVWCGVDAPVCLVVPHSHKLYRHHLSPTVPHHRVKTKCHLQAIGGKKKKKQTQSPATWQFYNIPTSERAAVDERQAQQLVLKQRDTCRAVGKEDRWDVSLWKCLAMTAHSHFTETATDIRCWGGGVTASEREVT